MSAVPGTAAWDRSRTSGPRLRLRSGRHRCWRALDIGPPGERRRRRHQGVLRAIRAPRASQMDRIEPATRIQPHAQRRAGSQVLERLGDRLEAYRGVGQHVLLVGGARSPGHFGDRIELLHRVPPSSDIRRMEGAGHTGPIRKAGDLVALLLADIATHVSV
jgi:hypothetical protein